MVAHVTIGGGIIIEGDISIGNHPVIPPAPALAVGTDSGLNWMYSVSI